MSISRAHAKAGAQSGPLLSQGHKGVMTPTVLSRVDGRAGRLSLNRPKAIHALDLDMVLAMTASLIEWLHDPEFEAVHIDHGEGRGFCAGGDVVAIARSAAGTGAAARAFFFNEYRLNHLLFAYPKPTAVFMDGIVMGGGVGVSVHGARRVAGDRTVFAMPETGIGLFPDVGGTWFLPRLVGVQQGDQWAFEQVVEQGDQEDRRDRPGEHPGAELVRVRQVVVAIPAPARRGPGRRGKPRSGLPLEPHPSQGFHGEVPLLSPPHP